MSLERVATFNSHNVLVKRMLEVQKRVYDTQVQVSTEKKSPNYRGIAFDAERLVDFENQSALLNRYIENNTIADLRLSAENTSVEAIDDLVREFRSDLIDFDQLDFTNPDVDDVSRAQEMEKVAFDFMRDLASYLNVRTEGRYLFAGGKTDTRPVQLTDPSTGNDYNTLADFQAVYDGTGVTYPTTRAAHMGDISVSAADYGTLSFTNATGVIASTSGTSPFTNIPVGSTITISGSGSNNGTFTVTANDGDNITVAEALTDEVASATETLTADLPNNYYQGDQLELEHRIDDDRSITLGINASNGAFEKVMRALGIMAQGDLENNKDTRVAEALNLLNDALLHDGNTNPTENAEDLSTVERTMGRNLNLLDDANSRHTEYIGFLETRIIDMENVDLTEAVTRLNDDVLALEVSMQAMARISQLSLAAYI